MLDIYNKETGGLVGVIWKQKVAKGEPRLTAALNYVADDGEQASSKRHVPAKSKGNTTAQLVTAPRNGALLSVTAMASVVQASAPPIRLLSRAVAATMSTPRTLLLTASGSLKRLVHSFCKPCLWLV